MQLLVTHGYLLSGTGSNVYVQNLCRALVRQGHDVHLVCQEPEPLSLDFVGSAFAAGAEGLERLGEQSTRYPGDCNVYLPDIGDLLPVYVYDDYPGWRVKTFLDLTDAELAGYLDGNVAALRTILEVSGADAVITNHSVPGPHIARLALRGTDMPYLSIVHGSCLQYVARRSATYMRLAEDGLEGANRVLALSEHSAGTIEEDFPRFAPKTLALPGGVDTEIFSPDALDLSVARELSEGSGRAPERTNLALEALQSTLPMTANDLASVLKLSASSYDPRSHDRDAGDRLEAVLESEAPLIVYLGKLIHSKGVHTLLAAFARVHRRTGARLLVIGFGTFREALEAMTHALSLGHYGTIEAMMRDGRLFEGGPSEPMEHFELTKELKRDARGMAEAVDFVGPLSHAELARILPAADAAVVPSIFPETFGLVAAECAASGVVPFVADHSGLTEAGGIVGRGLPFDLRVSLKDSFQDNLADVLVDYLERPKEERDAHRKQVRENAIQYLSWEALAEELVTLARDAR